MLVGLSLRATRGQPTLKSATREEEKGPPRPNNATRHAKLAWATLRVPRRAPATGTSEFLDFLAF
jgi:hypothetical protein